MGFMDYMGLDGFMDYIYWQKNGITLHTPNHFVHHTITRAKTRLAQDETRIAARKQKHPMFPSPAVDRCLGNGTSPIVLCVRKGPRTKRWPGL